jgi:hypothetical protein
LLHFLSLEKYLKPCCWLSVNMGAVHAPETHSLTVCQIKNFCHVMIFLTSYSTYVCFSPFANFPTCHILIHRQRILTPTY